MKKLFLLIFTCIICRPAEAQTPENLDNEKLLQYYQAQQYTDAVQYLQSIYKDSTDVKKLKHLAYANLMADNLAEAEKDYLRLNTQLPGNIAILTTLGSINTKLKQREKAKGYFSEVLKIDSNNFNACKQLASLEQDPRSAAKKTFLLKANQLNTLDADVAANLAAIYFKDNLFNKAEETLILAMKADSNNLQLLNSSMPIYLALKKYSEAIVNGKKLLEQHKAGSENNVPLENLLFQMAMNYRGIKDYKTAANYLQMAIKEGISSKIASYYGLLGDSYESMNQNKEAVEVYKRGLLFENNGSLYYNIALVYEDKLNDKKNAISYYSQYLNSIKEPEKQRRHVAYIKNKIEELKR
jgi:tetratricopeptide (TPR) repeat protein